MVKVNDKQIKYLRTSSFNRLLDAAESHQHLVDMEKERSIKTEEQMREMREASVQTRKSTMSLNHSASEMRSKYEKKPCFFYLIIAVSVIIVVVLILILMGKFGAFSKKENSNTKENNSVLKINSNIRASESNEEESINDLSKYLENSKNDKQTIENVEYDFCTDYPISYEDRRSYYLNSWFMFIFSCVFALLTPIVNRANSNKLRKLQNENFALKSKLCAEEVKLINIVNSIFIKYKK